MNKYKDVNISDERKKKISEAFKGFYFEHFDEEISAYKVEQVFDFFIKILGPNIYNQAIQDARGFIIQKLEDLDVEFYYPEDLT